MRNMYEIRQHFRRFLLCDNIVSVSSDLSHGVRLFIDSELAAVCTSEPLENLLDRIADNLHRHGGRKSVPFSNYIEYVEGLYKTDEISDDPDYVSVYVPSDLCRYSHRNHHRKNVYDYERVGKFRTSRAPIV